MADRTWIGFDGEVRGEVASGFERLPANQGFPILPHDPIQHPRLEPKIRSGTEADDGPRTRDLRLGKPTLYQLSYVRAGPIVERKAR